MYVNLCFAASLICFAQERSHVWVVVDDAVVSVSRGDVCSGVGVVCGVVAFGDALIDLSFFFAECSVDFVSERF